MAKFNHVDTTTCTNFMLELETITQSVQTSIWSGTQADITKSLKSLMAVAGEIARRHHIPMRDLQP